MHPQLKIFLLSMIFLGFLSPVIAQEGLKLNNKEYFATPGLNIMVFSDNYAEGHQGGITIIQHESRVAANGDIRLEPAPGQWQPIPELLSRKVNREDNSITVTLAYPDSNMIRRNFNPLIYPNLHFTYQIHAKPEGNAMRIRVDLEKPLPEEWIGRVGFNLELFPGELYDKSYMMDGEYGLFHRHLNGPFQKEKGDTYEVVPMAVGNHLVIAPDDEKQLMSIRSEKNEIQLLDGRTHHNNGWFVARSLVPEGATVGAIEWIIEPNVIENYTYPPVIQVSQVGYYPDQTKSAIIESGPDYNEEELIALKKLNTNGKYETVLEVKPEYWGQFQRYHYLKFDFSSVKEEGIYKAFYKDSQSEIFRISKDIYDRGVWQPTLEYFLPVQMCHMRINDRYRVWHGLCHMDDALMAPTDTVHIDGYYAGPSTLTKYEPYDQVPGLAVGGWHDAGDYDLRVESQSGTVRILSWMYENFGVDYDQTLIDQDDKLVEIHLPDGKQDILQQIEHGAMTVIAGYENLGRLYRGIITPTVRQYVLLGDAVNMSDNIPYEKESGLPMDDRWVFTEENPGRELYVSQCMAAAYRALKGYNDELADKCLHLSEVLYMNNKGLEGLTNPKVEALVELILSTGKEEYKKDLVSYSDEIQKNINQLAWTVVRVTDQLDNKKFVQNINKLKEPYYSGLAAEMAQNPYGLPYRPQIWGAGWYIQEFGVKQYYLYKHWNVEASKEYMNNALNFVLGRHPSSNNISYASGVGTKSTIVAYGVNRADWSYIPGGVVSGTSYIQPDLPEFKVWPFFWQQGEYVLGGGATNFMFLVLASQEIYNK